MEEISIVRRRHRVAPIVIAVLVIAAIAVAVLYLIGTGGVMNSGASGVVDTWAQREGAVYGLA